MTLYRTFISVELTEDTRRRVGRLQEDLRAAGARLRWVKAANLHFTLRFLGELPAAQVARAVVATRGAVRGVAPFAVALGTLGAFPSLERPQVVWLGAADGSSNLQDLAERIAAALAHERFPRDPRPFRPHLTLGRSKDDRQWGDLVRALDRFRGVSIGTEYVAAVSVMESRLSPDGPIYTPREQVPLVQGLNSPAG